VLLDFSSDPSNLAGSFKSPYARLRLLLSIAGDADEAASARGGDFALVQLYKYADKTFNNSVGCPSVKLSDDVILISVKFIRCKIHVVRDFSVAATAANGHHSWCLVNIWINFGKCKSPRMNASAFSTRFASTVIRGVRIGLPLSNLTVARNKSYNNRRH
jgi:hypothetical protein